MSQNIMKMTVAIKYFGKEFAKSNVKKVEIVLFKVLLVFIELTEFNDV